MKNLLLISSFLFCINSIYGQLKVVTNGNTEVMKTLVTGKDQGANPANVLVGLGRSASGNAGFHFYTDNTSSAQSAFFALASGDTQFVAGSKSSNGLLFTAQSTTGAMRFAVAGAVRMSLFNNGNVNIPGSLTVTNMNVPSDKRLKKDIAEYKAGLNEVLKLNPVTYQYNGKANTKANETFVGLIAQEVQEIMPELVNNFDEMDTDGQSIESSYLGLKESQIKFALINAIKDQQVIIDDLKKEIELIKGKLNNEGSHGITLTSDGSFLGQNYPNPTSDGITRVEYQIGNNYINGKIIFHDLQGRIISSINLDSKSGTVDIDVSDLESGIYTYSLVLDGKSISTKKISKIR